MQLAREFLALLVLHANDALGEAPVLGDRGFQRRRKAIELAADVGDLGRSPLGHDEIVFAGFEHQQRVADLADGAQEIGNGRAHQDHCRNRQRGPAEGEADDRAPHLAGLVAEARRDDQRAEILPVDDDRHLVAPRRGAHPHEPLGRPAVGGHLRRHARERVVDAIDVNVAELLEAVEEHLEAVARLGRALQALDGGLHELLGKPHRAVVLGLDARTGAHNHRGDEQNQPEREDRNDQGVEPEPDGHAGFSFEMLRGDRRPGNFPGFDVTKFPLLFVTLYQRRS